ncbi:16851_t:CDS:2, partial [Racocetra persica]
LVEIVVKVVDMCHQLMIVVVQYYLDIRKVTVEVLSLVLLKKVDLAECLAGGWECGNGSNCQDNKFMVVVGYIRITSNR